MPLHRLPTKRSPRRRVAAAAVEFAAVAPLLVFLIMGMVEASRAIMVKQVLSDAARAACRQQVLYQSGPTQTAKDILSDNSIDATKATVSIAESKVTLDFGGGATSVKDKVTVEVSILASNVSWVSSIFLSGSAKLSSTVHMMR